MADNKIESSPSNEDTSIRLLEMGDNDKENKGGNPTGTSITLQRRLYTQDQVDVEYKDREEILSAKERVKNACKFSPSCFLKVLLGYFPIIGVLRNYSWRNDIVNDCISGLSVSFMQMPQGLALGLLASVPPVFGLYATFFPVLFYVIFGTCRHVSMGTNAVLSLLVATIVQTELERYMEGSPVTSGNSSDTNATASASISDDEIEDFRVGVAAAVTFISGLFLLGMGLLKLGFITNYMSTSFVGGFTTAAAFHIATSQIPKMLQITVKAEAGPGKIVKMYIDIFKSIDDSNPADVITSVISCIFLLGVTIFINERYKDKLRVPLPVDLIIVVLSTIISYTADLEDKYGLAVVGDIPLGLPTPKMPKTEVMDRIVTDSFVMAILIFMMTITLAKLMAGMHNYVIDDDQELVSYGLCNFLSSFFSCIPNCTAPPRTMILSNIGARSTLNGIVTAAFILLVLLVAGQLFTALPIAVLAVMIAVAVKNLLLQVQQLPSIWRLSKPDFLIWVITCSTCILIDIDYGIVIGIAVSFITIIVRNQLASGLVGGLSKTEDLILYGKYRDGIKESNQFRIFYFPSQLFFASAERFTKEIFAKALNPVFLEPKPAEDKANGDAQGDGENSSPEVVTKHVDEDVKYVILDCSAMTYIDIGGANTLKKVSGKYKKVGVTLLLAKCPAYTLNLLDRAGYFKIVDRNTVFCDVYDAITYILESSA